MVVVDSSSIDQEFILYTVQNLGELDSPSFSLSVYLNGTITEAFTVAGLGSGDMYEGEVEIKQVETNQLCELTVDEGDLVREHDEENNVASVVVPPKTGYGS